MNSPIRSSQPRQPHLPPQPQYSVSPRQVRGAVASILAVDPVSSTTSQLSMASRSGGPNIVNNNNLSTTTNNNNMSSNPNNNTTVSSLTDMNHFFQQIEYDGSFETPSNQPAVPFTVVDSPSPSRERGGPPPATSSANSPMGLPQPPSSGQRYYLSRNGASPGYTSATNVTPVVSSGPDTPDGVGYQSLLESVEWFLREAERCFESVELSLASLPAGRKSSRSLLLEIAEGGGRPNAVAADRSSSNCSADTPLVNLRLLINAFKQRVGAVRTTQAISALSSSHAMSLSLSGDAGAAGGKGGAGPSTMVESVPSPSAFANSNNNTSTTIIGTGSARGGGVTSSSAATAGAFISVPSSGGIAAMPTVVPSRMTTTTTTAAGGGIPSSSVRSRLGLYESSGGAPNRLASFGYLPPRQDEDALSLSIISQARSAVEFTLSAQKTKDDLGVKTLNQYVLMQDIGRGASGKVKLAFDTIHNRLVAVKIIRKPRGPPPPPPLPPPPPPPPQDTTTTHRFGVLGGAGTPSQQGSDESGGAPLPYYSNRRESEDRRESQYLLLHEHQANFGPDSSDTLSHVSSGGGPMFEQRLSAEEVAQLYLRREIALMKKIRHKNIVSLFEVIDDPQDEKMYLVMQYVDEGCIASIRPDGICTRTFGAVELATYARQISAGLEYLHSRNVAHRDIKPENVLRSSSDQVYLADFGIAEVIRHSAGASGSPTTTTATAHNQANFDTASVAGDMGKCLPELGRGTIMFMSPELVRGDRVIDSKAADIWALGVMYFALLTGHVPFLTRDDVKFFAESQAAAVTVSHAARHLPASGMETEAGVTFAPMEDSASSIPETAPFGNSAAGDYAAKRVRCAPGASSNNNNNHNSTSVPSDSIHRASINFSSVTSATLRLAASNLAPPPPQYSSSSSTKGSAMASPTLFDAIEHPRWRALIASMMSVESYLRPSIEKVRITVKEIAKEAAKPPPSPMMMLSPRPISKYTPTIISEQPQSNALGRDGSGGPGEFTSAAISYEKLQQQLLQLPGWGGGVGPGGSEAELTAAITPLRRSSGITPPAESLVQLMDEDDPTSGGGGGGGGGGGVRQSANSTRRLAHFSQMQVSIGSVQSSHMQAPSVFGNVSGLNGLRMGWGPKGRRRN